ncbi:hypothetical protein BH24DEI1_BH24DEI1_16130 [soil metagenome]|nr:hypothetical protein [Deinococcota bacterium]
MRTLFVEMAGPEALGTLQALALALASQPECSAWRVLESEQGGLYLLELDWRGEALPVLPTPAKVWLFHELS